MDLMTAKFQRLGIDNAPGQEDRQSHTELELRGEPLPGPAVNFSHGDVDAHQPIPGSLETFIEGYKKGSCVAYTEYRGGDDIRKEVAAKLAAFTGAPIDPEKELILTPGPREPCSWHWAVWWDGETRLPSWNRITSTTGNWWNFLKENWFPSSWII